METQGDDEADVLLAVFPSANVATVAERAVEAAGIESSQSRLAPGRYQLADRRLASRFRAGIVRVWLERTSAQLLALGSRCGYSVRAG